MGIKLRPITRSDIPFVTSSWLKSFRDGPMVRGVPNSIYYHEHHKVLEQLIPRSTVLMAVDEEDEDQIAGFVCYEVAESVTVKGGGRRANAAILHYIYVKLPFRKFGVAKTLLDFIQVVENPSATFYTHSTRVWREYVREHNLEYIYNPYLLFKSWD